MSIENDPKLSSCPMCRSPVQMLIDDDGEHYIYRAICSNPKCLINQSVASGRTRKEARKKWKLLCDLWRRGLHDEI